MQLHLQPECRHYVQDSPLRLLSYNIQACIGSRHYSDYLVGIRNQVANSPAKDKTLKKIAKFISGFDIVCLQELDLGGRRSGFLSQFDALQELSGFRHGAAQTTRIISGISHHGNAILSRHPILETDEHALPGRMKGRGLLVCQIQDYTVANTHLSLNAKTQMDQLDLIRKVLKGRENTILAGDFNCRSSRPWLQEFSEMSGLKMITDSSNHTYPSWNPKTDIDHIFASRSLAFTNTRVGDVRLSDHLPVMTEIR